MTHKSRIALKRENFQMTLNGKDTDLFVLKNRNGVEIAVTNYGGFVVAIMVPDKNGEYADVVLGHSSLHDYLHTPEPYLGSLVGRYGNRIAGGKFILEGQEYTLAINNGPNSLHGGLTGFNAVVWDAEQLNAQTLKLNYLSVDGEEGFPGNLSVEVVYHLNHENGLEISYRAVTDKTTIVNLTQHSFFNLAGAAKVMPTVCNNLLMINADYYTPVDAVSIPTGEIAPVAGTPMDFRKPYVVGERINDSFEQLVFGKGYDHCYVLNKKEARELSFAAKVVEPESGRTLEVYTTEPGVQLYTGNWLGGFEGKYGNVYPERSAICLETQHFPDSPNKPHFPTVVLHPDEIYTQKCIYKFGVEK
ncbi:aldose epimerase family protein [Odoribacter lunatus]|uniref:aldose epimerase family protein n=1 Tax=Odoribacter lunatus TaxID=2941335 RepID=UPI00203E8147|nr:aldose epimerase family protein [Odoribacter lunatus]